MNTNIELVSLLGEVRKSWEGKNKDFVHLDRMIERARSGYYNDWKSPVDFPKVELAMDLQLVGLMDLKRQVINGDFDDEPDADDTIMMDAELAKLTDGEKVKLDKLMRLAEE